MNKNTSSGLSLLFTVLCTLGLNSCTVQATPDNAVIEQAEQHIRLQWQKNPTSCHFFVVDSVPGSIIS